MRDLSASLVREAYNQYECSMKGDAWEPKWLVSAANKDSEIRLLKVRPNGLFAEREVFGFIWVLPDVVHIVLRGTASHHDWLTNLEVDQIPHYLGGQVHSGFDEIAVQVYEQLECIQYAINHVPIFIHGHSLGAAVAIGIASRIPASNTTIFAWAPPRYGNPEFAEIYNEVCPNTHCIINTEDIVPTLPVAVLPGIRNFSHVGKVEVFTANLGSVLENHSMELYSKTMVRGAR